MFILIVIVSIANKHLLQLSQCYYVIIYCSNLSLFSGTFRENIKIRICIICHYFGPDRSVTTYSNSTFKGHSTRLRPFSLQFSIIFVHPVAVYSSYMSQPNLFISSQFQSTDSTCNSSKISSFLLRSKRGVPAIYINIYNDMLWE